MDPSIRFRGVKTDVGSDVSGKGCVPGEPHLEKNDGGIPTRTGTNTMGMRCPGTGSPSQGGRCGGGVMTNAVARAPGQALGEEDK